MCVYINYAPKCYCVNMQKRGYLSIASRENISGFYFNTHLSGVAHVHCPAQWDLWNRTRILSRLSFLSLYPRSTEGGMGYTGFTPMSVRPSVRPSVCRQGFRNFLKKTIGSIHFIPGFYPSGVSLLTPIHFRVPSLIFGPLVAKYLAENGVSGTFLKNYWPNSFHTWHLPLWGESLDPYIFSCSWPHFRPSGGQIFGRKSWGFRNFLKKNYGLNSFHTWHLSLWGESLDPYTLDFRVPSLIFGPLVNRVSGTFLNNYGLNSFHWYLVFTLWGEFLDPYTLLCS